MSEITLIVLAATVAVVTLYAMKTGYNIDIKTWFIRLQFKKSKK